MLLNHYLLLILTILPIIYKYSFWLYVIQLKEYRIDRFKEYLTTKQGKSAIVNMWSILEIILLFLGLIVFINKPFEIIIYNILFYFLIFYNIFVIGKIIRKKILKPKLTGRLLLIILLLIIGFCLDLYFIIFKGLNNHLYYYIPFILLSAPLIIFFYIFITYPFIKHKKNKLINKAIKKSHKFSKPIKIGITGSYGKSSIKEYLSTILSQDGKTLKTPENINTELGVSNIIINKLKNSYKYFIAEMGAYKIGEIDLLGRIVNHKYGFLTAVGNQHIALFGSQNNIKTGKSEIQNSVIKNKGKLYINWNNHFIREIKFDKKTKLVKYGNIEGADAFYKILNIKNGITEFEFKYKKHKTKFDTLLLGEHNILNLTGVLALCYDLGLKTKELKQYIKKVKNPRDTLNIIKKGKTILINDTYNLSEDGLYAGIDILNSYEGEKILVIDDILELGKQAEIIHKTIGKYIAEDKKIDKVLYCGINYKNAFLKGLIDGGFKEKNIINTLDNIKNKSVILFEGRSTKRYLNKLK